MRKYNPLSQTRAKLNRREAEAIYQRYWAGAVTLPQLAAEYEVNRSTITDIVYCRTWRNIDRSCFPQPFQAKKRVRNI